MINSFSISIGGNPLTESYEIQSIIVSKGANRIPFARIVLRDGNPAKADFPLSNSSDLIPGKDIVIQAGKDSVNETIFIGKITKHSVKMNPSGESILKIECKDAAHILFFSRNNGAYYDQPDSDIFNTIIKRNKLSPKTIDATSLKHPEMYQLNCTDWDFILSRADANGKLVIVNNGTVSVTAPDYLATPTLSYSFGKNIYEFETSMDARDQVSGTEARSWDPANQALIASGPGKEPSLSEQGNISATELAQSLDFGTSILQHYGALDAAELQAWADGKLYRSRLAKIKGNLTINGDASLIPGTVIKLEGLGERFNGNAMVSSVKHLIQNGDWLCEIGIGLDQKNITSQSEVSEPAAGGLLPGVQGLQTGIVIALAGDPKKEFRVQIRLPLLEDEAGQGIWARMAHFYAGINGGSFFLPEINDEVLIGFLQDDPRQPVILGSLYSSAQAPKLAHDDNNYQKAFYSASGMNLTFDDQNKVLTIFTPAGNQIKLSESEKQVSLTDQNQNNILLDENGVYLKDLSGNVLEMNKDGINLTSSGNISLKSDKDIEILAKGNIKMESSGDTNLNSTGNLVAQGNSRATFKSGDDALSLGNGSASLNSTGSTVVNGSMSSDLTSDSTITIKAIAVNIN